jgi:uncharacterized protein YdaU (DUF1376 family)
MPRARRHHRRRSEGIAMSKVDIWMPIYIGDYLRDTEELSAEEHGAYILLLMHYWLKGGIIGSNVDRLSRVARTTPETCSFILGYYFTLDGGNYKNKRADDEMANAESRRLASSENGKKGGRPTKNNLEKTYGFSVGNLGETYNEPKSNLQKSSSSSSSSSSSQRKREEEENTPAPIVAEPEPLIPVEPTKSVAVKTKASPLYHAINQCFLSKTPAFANYQKEAQAIKRIEAYASRYDPVDREGVTLSMIGKYWELVQSHDKFWHKQPFTPSGMASLMDRVVRELEINRPQTREEYEAACRQAEGIPF